MAADFSYIPWLATNSQKLTITLVTIDWTTISIKAAI